MILLNIGFLLLGVVGDWKNHLNADMIQALDRKLDNQLQHNADLKKHIVYEIPSLEYHHK